MLQEQLTHLPGCAVLISSLLLSSGSSFPSSICLPATCCSGAASPAHRHSSSCLQLCLNLPKFVAKGQKGLPANKKWDRRWLLLGTALLSLAAFGTLMGISPRQAPWTIRECCGTDSAEGDTEGAFPCRAGAAWGSRQYLSATEHAEAGGRPRTPSAPRNLVPKASSPSQQLWGKSSELAVRNLWTEPAEHSLVKHSAQWHFSWPKEFGNAAAYLL